MSGPNSSSLSTVALSSRAVAVASILSPIEEPSSRKMSTPAAAQQDVKVTIQKDAPPAVPDVDIMKYDGESMEDRIKAAVNGGK